MCDIQVLPPLLLWQTQKAALAYLLDVVNACDLVMPVCDLLTLFLNGCCHTCVGALPGSSKNREGTTIYNTYTSNLRSI
jgi:hypothetical protein